MVESAMVPVPELERLQPVAFAAGRRHQSQVTQAIPPPNKTPFSTVSLDNGHTTLKAPVPVPLTEVKQR